MHTQVKLVKKASKEHALSVGKESPLEPGVTDWLLLCVLRLLCVLLRLLLACCCCRCCCCSCVASVARQPDSRGWAGCRQ